MPRSQIPPDLNPGRFPGSFFDVAKAVLIAPKAFFSTMSRNGGFANPTLFLLACVGVHSLLARPFMRAPGFFFQNILMGMIVPFVTAGIMFIILTRLFKSPGTYEATFRINACVSAVGLLSWIPVAGMFLELYRFYLIVIGLRTVYTIKTSRAVITIVLTLIVYTVLFRMLTNVTGVQFIKLSG